MLGLLALASAPALEGALGTPAVLMRPLAVVLLLAAVAVGYLAGRRRLDRRAASAIVALNAAWAAASLVAVALGQSALTSLGITVVLTQAVATALLAALEVLALRRDA
jgi:hypothetical protein